MQPAAVVTILAALLIVAALVVYLIAIIGQLKTIGADLNIVIGAVLVLIRQTVPVNAVVNTINRHLDAGVDLVEGLLVKKAGLDGALALIEGLYPGAGQAGFRRAGRSRGRVEPIGEVFPPGEATLGRLVQEMTLGRGVFPGDAPPPAAAAPAAAAAEAEAPAETGRLTVIRPKPWEVEGGPTAAPRLAPAQGTSVGEDGRLSVVGLRPWER